MELITGLEDTKRIANDIAEKQKVAKQTEIDINITSEKYRPVASRGSLIFFLMNELFKVRGGPDAHPCVCCECVCVWCGVLLPLSRLA